MNFKGKRLMPTYLIDFLKDIYPGDIPANFGKRMVSRQLIAYLQQMYSLFGGKSIDNFGRDMCPEYLIKYLEYLINADYIEYEDDTVAYTKETPENALKYAFLNYVGGMSYKSKNLIVMQDVAETTENGITWKVENGTITIGGLASAATRVFIPIDPIPAGNYSYNQFYKTSGHNAYLSDDDNATTITLLLTSGTTNPISANITTTTKTNYLYYFIPANAEITTYSFTPMLVTGSTAPTEFKKGFEGIRESLVTSVNSLALKNNDDKYGWGIDSSLYNYRDYNENKGYQVVGRVDLGTLNWFYNTSDNTFQAAPENIKNYGTSTVAKILTSMYETISWSNLSGNDMVIASAVTYIRIKNSDYTDATDFKAAMSGVYLYYELANGLEEDIDPIDNVIDVSSGEVTFNNEYEQAVPSSISYFIPNV